MVHSWERIWTICNAQCVPALILWSAASSEVCLFLLHPPSLNLAARLVLQLFPTFPGITSSEKGCGHAAFVECGNIDTNRAWKCDISAVALRHLVVLLHQCVLSLLLVEIMELMKQCLWWQCCNIQEEMKPCDRLDLSTSCEYNQWLDIFWDCFRWITEVKKQHRQNSLVYLMFKQTVADLNVAIFGASRKILLH